MVKQIALERIYRLFELAGYEFENTPERSKRYVEIARKISSRNKVPMPHEFRKRFCKGCGVFLKAGKNAKFRVTAGVLKITCTECGHTNKTGIGGKNE